MVQKQKHRVEKIGNQNEQFESNVILREYLTDFGEQNTREKLEYNKDVKNAIERKRGLERNPLSKEFIVAVKIFDYNQKGENVWYSKLVESLLEIVSRNTIKNALDTLLEWKIITFEYGETDKRKASKLFLINSDCKPLIKELWENYWNKHE